MAISDKALKRVDRIQDIRYRDEQGISLDAIRKVIEKNAVFGPNKKAFEAEYDYYEQLEDAINEAFS